MNLSIFFGFILIISSSCLAQNDTWWRNMQLYQIYPRSFMDSNGDGIGDIIGISSRISHLRDIGVTATWMSPIFPSPMLDFGYDIANYTDIDSDYGTISDIQLFIRLANLYGIKVLLDFVPNHTSDQCEWFKKSVEKEAGFENFYVWHPGREDPDDPTKLWPPSNWVSVFRGSAWTWNEQRKEFYLHQFLPQQPDLNFRDPNVVEEMKNVLRFWLKRGVSGFRVDAIPHLIEVDVDESGNYPDEPLSGNTDDKDDYNYLNHIHTRERDETFDMVYQWRAVLDEYGQDHTRVLLMEAMSDIDLVMKYYGNETSEGAHFPFNFNLAYLRADSKAKGLKNSITGWLDKVPEGRVSNWVIGNHDQPRVATRFGRERSDGIVMLSMLLPGVSVTYQGEEIAMENFYPTWEQTKDPQACNSGIELFNITSRDPERTPFQWDFSENAGFSVASETWLPVADNFEDLNLLSQLEAIKSPVNMYKQLSKMRNTPVIQNGDLVVTTINDDEILAFSRSVGSGKDLQKIIVLVNTGATSPNVDLTKAFTGLPPTCKVAVTSVASTKEPETILQTNKITVTEYEALVLMVINGCGTMLLSKLLLIAATVCGLTR